MKTKALIGYVVTAKLICVFVFAYAKNLFSHDEAHMSRIMREPAFCICENKGAVQLISAFVFATYR